MEIRFGVLDQTPILEGETSSEAFRRTVSLAQKAEELGYHRFWVSEHHDSDQVVGSAPEVLISYLLAKTERIRIGSGGIMLQHYSPYKVAEVFNVLASLAPGRVDLGIGRAPGGLPRSTKALQQGVHEAPSLSEKIVEVEQFIHDCLDENHPLAGLRAMPIPSQPAELYLLGTSVTSAELAAKLGLPYVFALFISGDESVAREALITYRNRFRPGRVAQPQALLAIDVIVADTDEEAGGLKGKNQIVRINLESGKTFTVANVEQAEAYGKQSEESYTVEIREAHIIYGSKETVRGKLLDLQRKYHVDEWIITNTIKDFAKRIHSYELLKEAFLEIHV